MYCCSPTATLHINTHTVSWCVHLALQLIKLIWVNSKGSPCQFLNHRSAGNKSLVLMFLTDFLLLSIILGKKEIQSR